MGQLVAVKTAVPVDGERRFRGLLLAADDAGIELRSEPGATETVPRRFSYDQIQQTRTVLVWGPAPKPGRARPNGRSAKATAGAKSSAPMKDSAS